METLLIIGGLIGVALFVMYLFGKSKEREKRARSDAKVKDEQIKAEQNRPRDKSELADRIVRDDW